MFLLLAVVACASELRAQTRFQVRPITIQRSLSPVTPRVNPVIIPRSVTTVNPIMRNAPPTQRLGSQSVTIHLQRLTPAQTRALENAAARNNCVPYYPPIQTTENPADHIARLQGIIQSGTQGASAQTGPQGISVQPGAGLGYSNEMVRQVQTVLKRLGYYRGQVDGQFGSSTQDALQSYQSGTSQPVTGILDRGTLSGLGVIQK
jgi:hypothetical protein